MQYLYSMKEKIFLLKIQNLKPKYKQLKNKIKINIFFDS